MLVAIAANDTLARSFRLGNLFLKSHEPAVAFGVGRSLEGMSLTMDPEGELIVTLLGHIRCFSLRVEDRVSQAGSSRELYCSECTHQVNDTGRLSLIFHALGEEQKAFSRLTGMGNIRVSNVLLLTTEIAG